MGTISSNSSSNIPVWFTEVSEEPQLNFTDVKVVHDPVMSKPRSGREFNDGSNTKSNSSVSTDQVHGILVPIIDINGTGVDITNLVDMVLSFTDFTPTLELIINDPKGEFTVYGGIGLNNRISVILTPSSSGVYRKMSVPFYIKQQENLPNNQIKFICEYFHIGLRKTVCEQIGDKQLTTYELCETITKQLQLGFAATDKCKDIDDKRWRQIYSQRISNFINEQISIGGLDEDSIFDGWIDPYGYLNLVNLSWLYNEKVLDKDLGMYSLNKSLIPIESEKPKPEPKRIKRFLTNWQKIPLIENKIKEQYNNLCTEQTINKGTFRNCWIMKDAGGTNTMELQNIQMIENSVEGVSASDFYEFHTTEFLGVEMSEDTPYLYQKEIRSSYITKHRSRQITIILESPNYGFQRGQLINIFYVETDSAKMKKINARAGNLYSASFEKNHNREKNANEMDVDKILADFDKVEVKQESLIDNQTVLTDQSMIINTAITGIYYIDGIEYIYDNENQKILQYMYLIKKGVQSNLQNPYSGTTV